MKQCAPFTPEQLEELHRAARSHPDAHVRSRAIAVRAVALGHSRQDLARVLPLSAYSIGQAALRYQERGLAGLGVAPGRGRKSGVDEEQVRAYLRQSPERFGYEQARWTLALLGEACPALSGMSERGILKVLHRLGFRYKRGQQWIHSPDPGYAGKKTPSSRRTGRRSATRGR